LKKRLYLIGAGSFGREVESWIFQDINFFKNYDVIGFLDFNANALSGISFNFTNNDCILVCITDSESRKNIISSLKNNVEIISYISNKAIISEFVQIGLGSIICPNVLISTNVNIGNYNIINCGTQIGHDCIIGNYNSIMANVDLGGKVQIFDHVFIGTNSTIIPSRNINSNILIGAGSIVIKHLTLEGSYFGNPAKLIKI
jgi:sugar O-acyltransferase (sialic acid O-acetyltransferase NeuD family)